MATAENRIPQEPDADDWLKLAEEQWYDGDSKGAIGAAMIAIAERLDALNRTLVAGSGLCRTCGERPASCTTPESGGQYVECHACRENRGDTDHLPF